MNRFLLFLFYILFFSAQAQEVTTITISTSINTIACNNDVMERIYTLERLDNGKPIFIRNYSGTGCKTNVQEKLIPGQYQITVALIGFQEQQIPFEVLLNSKSIVLPTVTLVEKTTDLKEVTVFSNKKQFLKVDSDKTTVSVRENPMLNSGTSYEAIKRLPGVIASSLTGIKLNGRNVTIYIDGSPSTLSGPDLENYLNSLPANAIEKVELIYNPGAAFDANASGSIINIITSTKRMKGINASFNINYNFNRYQKPSPQILLNGREKNLSWQTMIGYNYIESENRNNLEQTFKTFTPVALLNQSNFRQSINRNFYLRMGLNYRLSEKSNLLLNYNNNFANDDNTFLATTRGQNIDFVNKGISGDKNANHEISLQYKTKLDTLGRTLDIITYSNLFDRNPFNESGSQNTSNNVYNNGKNTFDLWNYYIKYDFSIPFSKLDFTINTGGKFNSIAVTNNGLYNFNSPTPAIFGSGLYADAISFDYDETNLAFYAEARKKYKKFFITLGLRFEKFDVNRIASTLENKVTIENNNLFPTANVLYEITNAVNVSASYSRKIAQPSYFALDPNNSSNFDQFNTSQGNPLLNPTFFDNYELKFTALQFIQVGINHNVAKDNNLFILDAEPNQLISNQTFRQFDKIKTTSIYASFPIPLDYFFKGKEEFEKRMNTMDKMNYIYLNVNYFKTDIEGYNFTFKNTPIMNYAAQGQFMLPWNITNTMTYFILPNGNWEIYRITKPIQQFDISFTKDFLNKNLKIGIHAMDLFNQNEVNALVSSPNLDTQFFEKRDSRVFRISLSYNFGNVKLQKENTEINTEKVNQGGGLIKG